MWLTADVFFLTFWYSGKLQEIEEFLAIFQDEE